MTFKKRKDSHPLPADEHDVPEVGAPGGAAVAAAAGATGPNGD